MGLAIMARTLQLLVVAAATASAQYMGPAGFGFGPHPGHAVASPVQTAMFPPCYLNQGFGGMMGLGMPMAMGMQGGDYAKAQAAYQQQFASMVEQQKKSYAEWETAQKAALEQAQKTGQANPLGFGPYGMGFGYGCLPSGGGAYGLGLMGVNSSMPWAPAYPVINGGYRPSFPVPGVPSKYGSPGCGFGQNYLGCLQGTPQMFGGAPMMPQMGFHGMGHPHLAMHSMKKYNPMGYFEPHPSPYNVGAADAMNKYLGVNLFKPPTGQGLPWVEEPKAAKAAPAAA